MKKTPLIELEYATVIRLTKHIELLTAAHYYQIDPATAKKIVAAVNPEVTVKFRGYRGFCRPKKKLITLPLSGGNKYSTKRTMKGKLRLGIVLHELAHLISIKHYVKFVEAFDELLVCFKHWFEKGV